LLPSRSLQNCCCERFADFFKSGEIRYAYEKHQEVDETEWIIDGVGHLYYCPFCGAFIKGYGFGNYDETYPPAKGIRIISQRTD